MEDQLAGQKFLYGSTPSFADIAIAPFVRQFANADAEWFKSTAYRKTQRWLQEFVESPRFLGCMIKHKQWRAGDPPIAFP